MTDNPTEAMGAMTGEEAHSFFQDQFPDSPIRRDKWSDFGEPYHRAWELLRGLEKTLDINRQVLAQPEDAT